MLSTLLNEKQGVREFVQAMHQADLYPQGDILPDGKIHRFPVGKKGRKDGWYVFYGLAGACGDWSRSFSKTWSMNNFSLNYEGKDRLKQQLEKVKKTAEEEQVRKHTETAITALEKWETFSATGHSPYLTKKKVDGFGVRYHQSFLIIPIKDITGKLWSLQWIAPDGTKRFLPGGRKKGCFHHMGTLEDGNPIIITEGYATGASVYMATQYPIVIAFDAGNLSPVIEELRKAYPNSLLIIAGDDDKGKEHNVGREKAEQAAKEHNCRAVFPQFKDLSTNPTDFNDLHVLEELDV